MAQLGVHGLYRNLVPRRILAPGFVPRQIQLLRQLVGRRALVDSRAHAIDHVRQVGALAAQRVGVGRLIQDAVEQFQGTPPHFGGRAFERPPQRRQ